MPSITMPLEGSLLEAREPRPPVAGTPTRDRGRSTSPAAVSPPRDLVSVSLTARNLLAAERGRPGADSSSAPPPGDGRPSERASSKEDDGTVPRVRIGMPREERPPPRAEGDEDEVEEMLIWPESREGAEETTPAASEAAGRTPEERAELDRLRQRDREVRAHEQAHLAALGGEGGAASFTYEVGPDGRKYAVGGEVPVQIAAVPGDPHATLMRAERIAKAALAPAEPSAADVRAAAEARRIAGEARRQIQDERAGGSEARPPSSEPAAAASPESDGRVALELGFTIAGGGFEADHLHARDGPCQTCSPPLS